MCQKLWLQVINSPYVSHGRGVEKQIPDLALRSHPVRPAERYEVSRPCWLAAVPPPRCQGWFFPGPAERNTPRQTETNRDKQLSGTQTFFFKLGWLSGPLRIYEPLKKVIKHQLSVSRDVFTHSVPLVQKSQYKHQAS